MYIYIYIILVLQLDTSYLNRTASEVLEAWRRHSNGLCNEPILVTDENVRELVPDIPEELRMVSYGNAIHIMLKCDMLLYKSC